MNELKKLVIMVLTIATTHLAAGCPDPDITCYFEDANGIALDPKTYEKQPGFGGCCGKGWFKADCEPCDDQATTKAEEFCNAKAIALGLKPDYSRLSKVVCRN